MEEKKIIVSGGSDNLYRVTIYNNRYTVSHVQGLWSFRFSKIGEVRNMDDALSLIKAHSGYSIKEISNW